MTPATFPEANRTITKPEGMTDAECGALPAYSDGSTCISAWRLSWRERFIALLFGTVWLGVLSGPTQPPVWLSVRQPFAKQKLWPWRARAAAVLLLLILAALPALAQEPAGDPGNLTVTLIPWTEVAFSSQATPGTKTSFGGTVSFDGIVPWKAECKVGVPNCVPQDPHSLRWQANLSVSSNSATATPTADGLPTPVDFTNPGTWGKYAEGSLAITAAFRHSGTSVLSGYCEAGYQTALTSASEVSSRFYRHQECGLTLENKGNQSISVGLDHDGRLPTLKRFLPNGIHAHGRAPIPGVNKVAYVLADLLLGFKPVDPTAPADPLVPLASGDQLILRIGVNVGDLIHAVHPPTP